MLVPVIGKYYKEYAMFVMEKKIGNHSKSHGFILFYVFLHQICACFIRLWEKCFSFPIRDRYSQNGGVIKLAIEKKSNYIRIPKNIDVLREEWGGARRRRRRRIRSKC